jgi:hypothetical protein
MYIKPFAQVIHVRLPWLSCCHILCEVDSEAEDIVEHDSDFCEVRAEAEKQLSVEHNNETYFDHMVVQRWIKLTLSLL